MGFAPKDPDSGSKETNDLIVTNKIKEQWQ